MNRKPKKHDDGDEDAWLITYADMVTLLLCFFIIMFSLSSPNGQKFANIAHALQKYELEDEAAPGETRDNDLKEQIDMALGQSGYDKFIAVGKNEKFVSMELASDSFFEAGSATLTDKGVEVLKVATKQLLPLANKPVEIEVEGHTDDIPIATGKYPSNWELSAARAATVVRYFIEQGFPKQKLRAVAYAETRPKAPNEDSAGKPIVANEELNRRVVIKLLKTDDEEH